MDWSGPEGWLKEHKPGKWQAGAVLADYTSWRIGGPARLLVWPETEADCCKLIRYCHDQGVPLLILGSGTNLLVADEGVEALVIHTGRLRSMCWLGAEVTAEAGLPLAHLASVAGYRGLAGLTFAIGIPGSLGGALVMNAGAYGGEMADVVTSVRVVTPQGEVETFAGKDLGYSYRTSALRGSDFLVLSACLHLRPGQREALLAAMKGYLETRREKQPLELPSGGSVFRNPAGEQAGAGRFIEGAGLKGLQIGQAQISPKHANFIVNLGDAKAKDVAALIQRAQAAVRDKFGVALEREVIFWGVDRQ